MSAAYQSLGNPASSKDFSGSTSRRKSNVSEIPLQDLSYDDRPPSKPASPIRNAHTTTYPWFGWRQKFSQYWIWELSALAFSMICIAIIIVVLLYEDGKRLDQWALVIPPNAVISFIAALAKSSCVLVLAEVIGQLRWMHFAKQPRQLHELKVFDDASRGPWGAFKFILTSTNVALLGSCASILTIAALMIDPFSQLVLTFPTRATPATGQVASLKVGEAYDAHTTLFDNHGGGIAVAQNAPFHLQSAIISAAFGVDPIFELDCPTSNCTYPPLSTFGVCSACQDMIPESNTKCNSNGTGIFCHTTVPSRTFPVAPEMSTIPIAPVIDFPWSLRMSTSGSYGIAWNSSSSNILSPQPNIYLPHGQPAVFGAFTSIKIDEDVLTAMKVPQAPSQLTQCNLTYCLKTYEGLEVRRGETNTGPVRSQPMLISSHTFTAGGSEELQINMSAVVNGTTKNYTINYADYLNIGQYMYDVLNSSVGYEGYSFQPSGNMVPTFGLAMYNADNITQTMDRIAEGMTNSMRTAQSNLSTIEGTALVNETYINIEWKWLALPIIIVLLALVLLILVIMRTNARGIEAWKSSSLPLLFYDLEGWNASTKRFGNATELSEISTGMKGRLVLDRNHRVFERDEPSQTRWFST